MGNIAKNDKRCYNSRQEGVYSMIGAIDNLIYENKKISKVDSSTNERLDLIYLISRCKRIKKANKEMFDEVFVSNKDIANGKDVIKGTRITPDIITNYYVRVMKNGIYGYEATKQLIKDYPSIDENILAMCIVHTLSKMSYIKAIFGKDYIIE